MDRALTWCFQPDHQIKEFRFATTCLSDDRHHFTWSNGKIETVDRDHSLSGRSLPEYLSQPTHLNGWGPLMRATVRRALRHVRPWLRAKIGAQPAPASRQTRRRPKITPVRPTIDVRYPSRHRPALRW